MKRTIVILFSFLLTTSLYAYRHCSDTSLYQVGTGIYDITGPAAETGMMGYGMVNQKTSGIYQRLWARAFVIAEPCTDKRIVIVNADLGMIFQGIKQHVIANLQKLYGKRYTDANVLITATHTHSGPGGFATDTFYNLTTFGIVRKNFDTIVTGIVAAIKRADANLGDARIKLARGNIEGISYNRSPTAYLLNAEEDRAKYQGDVDNEMTLLRFERLDGTPFATINWFPLHGVSFNNKNTLINGDNKGYAEYQLERDYQSDYGAHAFVAAFAQANAADVTPNPLGTEGGAGEEGIKLTEAAGKPQYQLAKRLLQEAKEEVSGAIDYRHQFVAMDEVIIDPRYTDEKNATTCPAAIGVSMLAGTQDGEGIGDQGVTCDTITSTLPRFICEASRTDCQGIKPIALSTGTKWPHPWTPNILPLQILEIGNLIVVGAPFELTTMTGRRIREEVAKYFPTKTIVLAGLSNAYAGYVATREEYELQRYEAASTHFGPWTQAALSQHFAYLAKSLSSGKDVMEGPIPPDLLADEEDNHIGVVYDAPPSGKHFGDVFQDVAAHYSAGSVIRATFWGGHPTNDYRLQDGYLAVQQLEDGQWKIIRHDRDWDTEYHWQRSGLAASLIEIVWRTDKNTKPGIYRLVHYGDAKEFWSRKVVPYVGYSSVFSVD